MLLNLIRPSYKVAKSELFYLLASFYVVNGSNQVLVKIPKWVEASSKRGNDWTKRMLFHGFIFRQIDQLDGKPTANKEPSSTTLAFRCLSPQVS